MNTTTSKNHGICNAGSIYRFAVGTDYKRTAVALKDGRFLEVKPIRQMFTNGDAWSVSFMGEGATLADGIAAGKITVEPRKLLQSKILLDSSLCSESRNHHPLSAVPKDPSVNNSSTSDEKDKQIAKQISMLKSLQEKSRNIQNEIRNTVQQLTFLQMESARFESERTFVEDTLAMLLRR